YSILLFAVIGAIVYGVLNDQITSTISWEYFYYGKDLAEQLGPRTPPDALALHRAAALVGVKATWSAGLIIGVAQLLANTIAATQEDFAARRDVPVDFKFIELAGAVSQRSLERCDVRVKEVRCDFVAFGRRASLRDGRVAHRLELLQAFACRGCFGLHHFHEDVEEVAGVVGAWAGFGVVLDRKHRRVLWRKPSPVPSLGLRR
ncbi:MAG: hypothetical protein JWN40_520, partial [Phycisphaerales bacterium]|nr:hypothetical protein [Phycisphaerales bacterium]